MFLDVKLLFWFSQNIISRILKEYLRFRATSPIIFFAFNLTSWTINVSVDVTPYLFNNLHDKSPDSGIDHVKCRVSFTILYCCSFIWQKSQKEFQRWIRKQIYSTNMPWERIAEFVEPLKDLNLKVGSYESVNALVVVVRRAIKKSKQVNGNGNPTSRGDGERRTGNRKWEQGSVPQVCGGGMRHVQEVYPSHTHKHTSHSEEPGPGDAQCKILPI